MLRRSGLRNPFVFPVLTGRLLYPAAAACLAALTAVTVLTALPSLWRNDAVAVALTSGGKFAARIAGAEAAPPSALSAASQGTSLPFLARSSVDEAVSWLSTAAMESLTTDESAPKAVVSTIDRHLKFKARAEGRRLVDAVMTDPKAALSVDEAALAKPDEGLMPKILASARSAWSVTTSAGGSLMSHILPSE